MSLVDYPLFSWVVVIHSLHVSSFLEATSDIVLVILKNYNVARNNECKKLNYILLNLKSNRLTRCHHAVHCRNFLLLKEGEVSLLFCVGYLTSFICTILYNFALYLRHCIVCV